MTLIISELSEPNHYKMLIITISTDGRSAHADHQHRPISNSRSAVMSAILAAISANYPRQVPAPAPYQLEQLEVIKL